MIAIVYFQYGVSACHLFVYFFDQRTISVLQHISCVVMKHFQEFLITLIFSSIIYKLFINFNNFTLIINFILSGQTSTSRLANLLFTHVINIDVLLVNVAHHCRASIFSLNLKLHTKLSMSHTSNKTLLSFACFFSAVHISYSVLFSLFRVNQLSSSKILGNLVLYFKEVHS